MLKFCPECGSKLIGGKFCANCGVDLTKYGASNSVAEDINAELTLDDALGNLMGFASERQAEDEKVRILLIRGKYTEAKNYYENLIDKNPMDKMGYIGLIRVASKNYNEYEGAEVSEQIRIAEEIIGADELLTETEYANYISARKRYLEEKERKAKELEIENAKNIFDLETNPDGTYTITRVKDKSLTSIEIPSCITGIGKLAFCGCSALTSITIPNSVTSIGDNAFQECKSLKSIEIPNSVKNIGHGAFFLCSNLTNVHLGNGVTKLEGCLFGSCKSLTSIEIPKSVTSIDGWIFADCDNLASIKVNSENTKYYSIDNCIIEKASKTLVSGIKNCIIPSDGSVTNIGAYAFAHRTNLTVIEIPDSILSIGESTFFHCSSLASIKIGKCVTSIGEYAFEECSSLTYIELPKSLISIGECAFNHCSSLKSVTIPDSVTTSIGMWTFGGCRKLTSVKIGNSVPSLNADAFTNCDSLVSVSLPLNCEVINEFYFPKNCKVIRR